MTADIKLVIANPDITGMPPPAPVILVAIQLINLIVSKVQAPTSAVAMVQLATANINAVLVPHLIRGVPPTTPAPAPQLINTLAAAPAIPAAPALPVMANIKNVIAPQAMNGKMELVPKPVIHLTNILVPVILKTAALAPLVEVNIPLANV